jgi:hypothetical protein
MLQLLTCPHCAAGFATHGELHAHGYEVHRDLTPKEHDQLQCAYCAADFEERTMRDEHVAENRRRATEILDEQNRAGS